MFLKQEINYPLKAVQLSWKEESHLPLVYTNTKWIKRKDFSQKWFTEISFQWVSAMFCHFKEIICKPAKCNTSLDKCLRKGILQINDFHAEENAQGEMTCFHANITYTIVKELY